MFVLNIRYSIRVKHLHVAFGCFSVCFVQTKLIMLCIIVPTYLYLFSNYKPLLHCVLMQTCIYIHFTVSPSAHCRVQNTHGDRVLSGRRGVGEHQTTWLIRQCVDCICFPFVSHRLHWRRSAVIKPLSETEIGESWGERHSGIMRWEQQRQNDKSLVEQCREMEIPPSGISYCNGKTNLE